MTLRHPAARRLSLLALVLLVAPGCDSDSGSDDGSDDGSSILSEPSASDRSDLAKYLSREYDCDAEVGPVTGTESGTLGGSDCAPSGGPAQDFYAFEVEDDADVAVELESEDFPPYLFLLSADPDAGPPEVVAIGTAEGDRAAVSEDLEAGLYLVVATSFSGGQQGSYTLSVEAGRPGR